MFGKLGLTLKVILKGSIYEILINIAARLTANRYIKL